MALGCFCFQEIANLNKGEHRSIASTGETSEHELQHGAKRYHIQLEETRTFTGKIQQLG